ncbi:MAG TPA: DegT/DnrJ/EryC1/StrS family aminotransferase [Streptosporangiaceae bacterium]
MDLPNWPDLTDDDIAAVVSVLRKNRLTQLSSDAVAQFEAAISGYLGGGHAVAVSTGTAAVHLALCALRIGPGDEVIVPAHTYVASASPIVHQGAQPVFADVDPVTHCIDPISVEKLITPRTRAIIVVHINGCPADMAAISALAGDAGIPVVEDSAQALGAAIGDRPVGTFGDIACFSFFEQKVITAGGEGGLVLTSNPEYAHIARRLRTHGEDRRPDGLIWSCEAGYNYRLTAMQAALATAQLARVDQLAAARRQNAAYLSGRLAGIPGLETPIEPEGTTHAFWKYALRVNPETVGQTARDLIGALRERSIPALFRYPFPVHKQPAFAAYQDSSCPVAERLSRELLTVPTHPGLTPEHLDHVAAEIRACVGM